MSWKIERFYLNGLNLGKKDILIAVKPKLKGSVSPTILEPCPQPGILNSSFTYDAFRFKLSEQAFCSKASGLAV